MPKTGPVEKTMSRKEQIAQIALKLFSAKGTKATGMRELAAAVGMKAGSLYNHFRSKEEIIDLIVEESTKGADELREYHAGLGEIDITEMVRKCVECWLVHGEENREVVLFFYREPQLLNPSRHRKFLESTKELISFFKGLLQEGIDSGEFIVPYPDLVAFNIWGLQLAWIFRFGLLEESYPVEAYAKQQADLIVRQITAKSK